jgi:hypothetical protein
LADHSGAASAIAPGTPAEGIFREIGRDGTDGSIGR